MREGRRESAPATALALFSALPFMVAGSVRAEALVIGKVDRVTETASSALQFERNAAAEILLRRCEALPRSLELVRASLAEVRSLGAFTLGELD